MVDMVTMRQVMREVMHHELTYILVIRIVLIVELGVFLEFEEVTEPNTIPVCRNSKGRFRVQKRA